MDEWVREDGYDDVLAHVAARRRSRRRRNARRGRRSLWLTVLTVGGIAFLIGTAALGVGTVYGVQRVLKGVDLKTLKPALPGINSKIYDRNGHLLAVIPSTENRTPVPYSHISRWLKVATVDIEDHRFYEHGGVDWQGVLRAFWDNVRAGHIVQGGSTLEQQVVRNMYLSDEQTLTRKIREAWLATQMADQWSKQKILRTYLNIVPYGGVTYGCEAAALQYFNVHCRDLSAGQAALIAGLPQSPTEYDPFVNRAAALDRRNQVLKAMYTYGDLSRARYQRLAHHGLRLHPGHYLQSVRQPYFVSYVRSLLQQRYGANQVRYGGLRVTTTVDQRLQAAAHQAIESIMNFKGAPAAALVAMDPRTGEILALDASTDFKRTKYDLPVQAKRQAGSTFKPFGLAAAIADLGINPDTTYYSTSQPFVYNLVPNPVLDTDVWKVYNAEAAPSPVLNLHQALQYSVNTVYARLSVDIGAWRTAQMAYRLGIPRSDHLPSGPTDYAVILGTGAVSPLDMTTAYSTFADHGIRHRPLAVTEVRNAISGRVIDSSPASKNHGVQAISDGVAYEITKILDDNVHVGGTGLAAQLPVYRAQAGKTGTTENHADAWFCGYTPNLVSCVWMGYPKGEIPMDCQAGDPCLPIGPAFGGGYPAEIWRAFAERAIAAEPGKFPPTPWPFPKHPVVFQPFTSKFQKELHTATATHRSSHGGSSGGPGSSTGGGGSSTGPTSSTGGGGSSGGGTTAPATSTGGGASTH